MVARRRTIAIRIAWNWPKSSFVVSAPGVGARQQRREIDAKGQELKVRSWLPRPVQRAMWGQYTEYLPAERVQVVVVEQSNMLINARKQIAEAAAAKKFPSIYGYREHVEAGGLISYGVDLNWCFSSRGLLCRQNIEGYQTSGLASGISDRD
jgi:putative ABC transport system substrate-binding protein